MSGRISAADKPVRPKEPQSARNSLQTRRHEKLCRFLIAFVSYLLDIYTLYFVYLGLIVTDFIYLVES